MPSYNGQTSQSVKIKLKSYLVAAHWLQLKAARGAEATLEVQTAYVADETEIKIQVKSSSGKNYDSITGKMYSNFYRKIIKVPMDDISGLSFEAELAGHGIKKLSSLLNVCPPVSYGKLSAKDSAEKKEVSEISSGEIIVFEADIKGPKDGEPAQIHLYLVQNEDEPAKRVNSFNAIVKNEKVSVIWDGKLPNAPKESMVYFEVQCLGAISPKSSDITFLNLPEFSFSA